jgi:hypothetical protein
MSPLVDEILIVYAHVILKDIRSAIRRCYSRGQNYLTLVIDLIRAVIVNLHIFHRVVAEFFAVPYQPVPVLSSQEEVIALACPRYKDVVVGNEPFGVVDAGHSLKDLVCLIEKSYCSKLIGYLQKPMSQLGSSGFTSRKI